MRRYETGQRIRHDSGQIFVVRAVRTADYDIECIEGTDAEMDRGVFEVHADYAHRNFKRSTGIKVTVVDHESDDSETRELRDYILITGTHKLTHTQQYANGTIVLTLKPEDVVEGPDA